MADFPRVMQFIARRLPKLTSKSAYQVLQTVVGMGIFQVLAFVAGIVIARGLGPAGQGRFQLLMSITTFTAGIAKLGLDEGLSYLIPKYSVQRADKTRSLIIYTFCVSIGVSLLLGIMLFIGAAQLERHFFKLAGFAADLTYAPLLFPTMMLMLMGMAALRGQGRSDLRAYVYYYAVGISFLAALIILQPGGLTNPKVYWARIESFALGGILALILLRRALAPRGQWALAWADIQSLHSFAGFLIFSGLFQYIVEQPLVDLIIVGRISSADTVGVYSVAARAGALVAIVTNAMTIVMGPALAEAAAQKDAQRLTMLYQRASEWMARLSVFTGISLFLLRTEVLRLFGEGYQDGVAFLVVFLLGQVIVGLMGLNIPLLLASGYAWIEFWLTAAAALVMVVGGVTLGLVYGALGVAVATALAAGMLALARRVICWKLFRLQNNGLIVRILFTGLISGGLALLTALTLSGPSIYRSLLPAIVHCTVFSLLTVVLRR